MEDVRAGNKGACQECVCVHGKKVCVQEGYGQQVN